MAAMRVLLSLATFSALAMVILATSDPRPEPERVTRRPVGAFRDVEDVNSETVVNAVDVGADHLASKPGNPCREAYSVQRIQQQVVSGVKYRITFRVNGAACDQNDGVEKICHVDVVVQSWRNTVTPMRPRCQNA